MPWKKDADFKYIIYTAVYIYIWRLAATGTLASLHVDLHVQLYYGRMTFGLDLLEINDS